MKFFVLSVLLCASLVAPVSLHAANITNQMINGVQKVNLPSGGDNPETTALNIVSNVIQVFLGLLGIIFFTLMLYAGYKWMMAAGRDDEISMARDTIRAAIIGLIIVLAAYAITIFITSGLQNAI